MATTLDDLDSRVKALEDYTTGIFEQLQSVITTTQLASTYSILKDEIDQLARRIDALELEIQSLKTKVG